MFDEQASGTTRCLSAKALCVTNDALAAETGADMMRRGGNAFDAAVAAGFMETVVAPHNCGIGGYAATGVGFVAKTRQLVALDANAVAPQAAHADMFPIVPGDEPNAYTRPDDAHKRGALSVAVPGVLGGLLTMLEKWGRLDRRTVMAPAIRQAREGVAVSPGRMIRGSWINRPSTGTTPDPQRAAGLPPPDSRGPPAACYLGPFSRKPGSWSQPVRPIAFAAQAFGCERGLSGFR